LLLSMTGFGEARSQRDGLAVAVETRSINNRYLKLSVRCGEGYACLEPQVENVLREKIRRGTVQVNVRINRAKSADDYRLDTAILDRYRADLTAWQTRSGVEGEIPLASLLSLPGVVSENSDANADAEAHWPLVRDTLMAAIENMDQMRTEEGRAMEADLRANCRTAAACLGRIEVRAPLVVEGYRTRLEERLKRTLAEYQVTLDPGDLIKEVGLFGERSDISEEIVRLRSHLEQFETIMTLPESAGRKLDFLTQEMSRETNTIGSKANDVEIAREVIEIKSAVERIREMIQNVE
jgi:uncharacterized protein (TIGR00255 family)